MDVLRLVLVGDYRMVTEALASRLSAAPDLSVADTCTSTDPRLSQLVSWRRPDVIVIHARPAGLAVAGLVQQLQEAWPAGHVVIVSADDDVREAVDAARAGADAWVSRTQGAAELESVIRGVCAGSSWYPPQILGEVLRQLRDDIRRAGQESNPLDVLSPRERDVLASMVEGKHGQQIAAELLISPDTVRTHTRSIFSKLDVHTRLQAVRIARAAGLRPPERPASQHAVHPPAGRAGTAVPIGSAGQRRR
ncbi:MAG TPA: response regulator transcription factor [Streptosporangiaceae bacterium]